MIKYKQSVKGFDPILLLVLVFVVILAFPVTAMGYSQTGPITVANAKQIESIGAENLDCPWTSVVIKGTRYWYHSDQWGDYTQKFTGPMDNPTKKSVWKKHKSTLYKNAKAINGNSWLVNVYRDPNTNGILGFLHIEAAAAPYRAGGMGGKGRIALAWSTDGGDTFTYLGEILAPHGDPDLTGGFLQGSPYLINDGYFYTYYNDAGATAVARAEVTAVIDAAQRGTVCAWNKYYNGGWTEPGLGGNYTSLGVSGICHTQACYSTYDHQYYLVMTSMNWNGVDTYAKLYQSPDGVNWNLYETVVDEPAGNFHAADGYQYASIVDCDGADDATVGQRFYLYCGRRPYFPDRSMLRWTIDLGGTHPVKKLNSPTASDSYQFAKGFSSVQGQNNWYYMEWNGKEYKKMTWDKVHSRWQGSYPYCLVGNGWAYPDTREAVIAWKAPRAGIVSVTGDITRATPAGDGTRVKILQNGNQLWPTSGWQDIRPGVSTRYALQTTVAADDMLYFHVNQWADPKSDMTKLNLGITYNDAVSQGESGNSTSSPSASSSVSGASSEALSTDFSSTQGDKGWYYQQWDGATYTDMTWDASNNRWKGTEQYCLLGDGWGHPGSGVDAVLKWIAPQAGNVTITGSPSVGDSRSDGVVVKIVKVSGGNIATIWGPMTVAGGGSVDHNVSTSLAANDVIYCIINKNENNNFDATNWAPKLTME